MYGIAVHPRGWAVSIQRQGVTYKKAFFASTHGGNEAALAHAQAWRDFQQARHPPMTQQQYARTIRQNNTSGHPGIICCKDEDGNPVRWLARTQVRPGLKLTRSFSVAKYGKRMARMLAIAEREAQLQQLQGFLMPHPAALADPDPAAFAYPGPQLSPKAPKSLTPGVFAIRNRGGNPTAWVALTQRGSQQERATFLISRYGEEGAKSKALAERRRQVSRIAKK